MLLAKSRVWQRRPQTGESPTGSRWAWRARCPGSPSRRRSRCSRPRRRPAFCASSSSPCSRWYSSSASGKSARSCTSRPTRRTRRRSTGRDSQEPRYSAGAARRLRLERTQVRGDRHHVFDTQLGDHRFHQLREGAGAIAVLHVVQLANDVDRRASGDARQLAQSLERWAVADRAGNGLPRASARHQRLAFREAADRHVGDEAGMGIAAVRSRGVLRQYDDAVADRLGAAVGRGKAHGPRAHVGFRHGGGLDHLRPHARLQRGEIFAGGAHVGVRNRLGDLDHRVRPDALPASVPELGHLAHEIRDGEAREAGGFGVAVSRRKMAEGAGARRFSPGGDDLRHRRMLVGKPVGGIEAVVDLRLRVFLRAPGHLLLHDVVERRRLGPGRVGPVRVLRADRGTGKRNDEPQNADEISHERLPFLSPRYSALIPASRITLPHCSYSLRRNAAASSGEPDAGSPPSPDRRSRISGAFIAFTDSALRRSITARGVPAGASSMYQLTATRGVPASAAVGTSGMALERFESSTASARRRPSFTYDAALEAATITTSISPPMSPVSAVVALL